MTRAFRVGDTLSLAGVLAAVAAVTLLVGGCGGGGGGQGAGSTTSMDPNMSMGSTPAAGVVLSFTGTEYAYVPPTAKAAAGKTTIRFTNKGTMEHDFVIDALHVKLAAKPGKTVEATVTLKPGTYEYYCSIPGHRQSGMQGKLIVK